MVLASKSDRYPYCIDPIHSVDPSTHVPLVTHSPSQYRPCNDWVNVFPDTVMPTITTPNL